MSHLILKDKVGITDHEKTIRGFVSIFDNLKKEFIFKDKENLVMKSGREFVKQLFTVNSGILGKNIEAKFPTNYVPYFNLSACVFGTNSNVSQYDMSYVPGDYVLDYTILTNSPEFSINYTDDMVLQITMNLNGLSTKQTMISSIALVLTTGEDTSTIKNLLDSGDTSNTALFSRLVFDPIPVGAGTSQTITYCIYF